MRKLRHNQRRGAAVVELAVLMPLLMMILLGTIQFGYLFMVRQTLVRAACEGARVATLPGASDTDIIVAVEDYMAGAGLSGDYSIAIQRASPPANLTEEVSVSIPYTAVWLVGDFFGSVEGKTLESTSRQRRL